MANTTNLNLVKPAGTDHALVSVINSNMDIIDSKVGAVPSNASVQGQIDTLNNQIEKSHLYINTTSDLTSAYSDMSANESRTIALSATFMYSLGLGDSAVKGTALKISTYLDCEVASASGDYYTIRFNGSTGAKISSTSISNQIVNNALTVPTAGTGITINDGGYTQIGKLIILNVRFTNDNAISTVGFEVLKSMPTPKTLNSQNYVPVNGYNIGDCFINSSGSLQYNGTLSAGMHMANAVYVCN